MTLYLHLQQHLFTSLPLSTILSVATLPVLVFLLVSMASNAIQPSIIVDIFIAANMVPIVVVVSRNVDHLLNHHPTSHKGLKFPSTLGTAL
ncbi:hypothetical protein C8J56DRAFT_919642 [Mycena floridula]|nr:hypothetical protein C8J56DRAFT_919642 [Mycena floridula]